MKTKILLLHNVMWSHYKGIVFSEFYELLKEKKYELLILQLAATGKKQKEFGAIDLTSHRYPHKLLFNTCIEEIPWYKQIFTVFNELIAFKHKVIIVPGYAYLMCWCALLYSKLKGTKIIIAFDSTEMDNDHYWYKEWIKKQFIAQCDAALCYGTKSKEYLLRLGMVESKIYTRCQATNNQKILDIYSATIANRDSIDMGSTFCRFNYIYVGRLSREKNISSLLSAFAKIKRANVLASNWGLIIVGDGPEKQPLQKNVTDLQIPDVFFVGGKSWDEIPKYFTVSNVFVLPSLSEPWGLVVNEAMVCGLPVVVSNRCGAAHDIVMSGKNGFIFDPLDIDDLAQKMEFFIDNPLDIEKMGRNSLSIIADYTPKHAAEQMLNALEMCCKIVNDK